MMFFIIIFKTQNELSQMTYAVKTVENLFTWCGLWTMI